MATTSNTLRRRSPTRRTTSRRTDVINIRTNPQERALIDQAAQSQGKTRSDFMLDASRYAAIDALLNQTFFSVNPEIYDQYVAMLDTPPNPNASLRKLMQTKAPWE